MEEETEQSLPQRDQMTLARKKGPVPDGGEISDLYFALADSFGPESNERAEIALAAHLTQYGMRLRQARKAAGWTQASLAEKTGIPQAQISRIESGAMKEGPTLATMVRLGQALPALQVTAPPSIAGQESVRPSPEAAAIKHSTVQDLLNAMEHASKEAIAQAGSLQTKLLIGWENRSSHQVGFHGVARAVNLTGAKLDEPTNMIIVVPDDGAPFCAHLTSFQDIVESD